MAEPDHSFYQKCDLYEYRSQNGPLEKPSGDWRFVTCLEQIGPGKDNRLLDIGCGDGGFLALAYESGFDVSGLDVDPRAVDLARTGRNIKDVRHGSWTDLEKMNGWKNLDRITMFDVLEHLSSPVAVLSSVSRLLAPGGELIVTVPRLDRYPRLFDKQADIPPHHLTLWTGAALTSVLDRAGFEKIRVLEKPLKAEDLLGHLVWRIKALLRRNKLPVAGNVKSNRAESIPITASIKPLVRLLKSVVHVGLGGVVSILRASGLARGHTLMLIAKKPADGRS